MNNSELIKLQNINKIYQSGNSDLVVLKDINLSIESGESVIITGESGCGKSTLLNMIGGLDKPSSGKVYSCGFEISALSERDLTGYRNGSLGFIFQFHFLLKDFNTLENIMMPALMGGLKRSVAREKAAELLDKVGLTDRAEHFPSQLSGGERQRTALARALINDPPLLLADEPTGNLDEKNSRMVEDILFDLARGLNKTLLLVTHDLTLAEKGSRHIHLSGGGVQEV